MKKIMFICLGNICRSPMAEFIMKDLIKKAGATDKFLIESRATCDEELGNGVYPPARAVLEQNGVPYSKLRTAHQLERSDYDKYDLFICMDSQNVSDAVWILGGDPQKKVCKLLDFTPEKGDVADPYFTRDFNLSFRQIYSGCQALLKKLL